MGKISEGWNHPGRESLPGMEKPQSVKKGERKMDEMKATEKEMEKEALKRLEKMSLHPDVVKGFKEGVLYRSDRTVFMGNPFGALFWLEDKEKNIVRKVEKMTGGVVYHMTHEKVDFGEFYDVFYVSPYKEEWEADAEDMKNDLAVVYVENVTGPDLSEFGTIQYKSAGGGLIRIR